MADPLFTSILSQIDPTLVLMIFAIGIVLGLILTFAGKLLWKPFMSILGGFVGATAGFALGMSFGLLGGLIGAMIGGFIGSFLFAMIVQSALAGLAAVLASGIVFVMTGSLLAALISGFVVLILALIFIKKVIGALTAILGALIVGVSMMGLGIDIGFSAIISLVLMIAGGLVQTFVIKDAVRRTRQAAVCSKCGGQMSYNNNLGRWYCPNCAFDVPPAPPDTE